MTEPIRVAQVMGKMLGGGVEAVVMNYYRHIDRAKVQFDFIVDDDSTLVPRDEIGSLGGGVFTVPPYRQIVRYSCVLEELFGKDRWPIVHSHVNALSVLPLRAAKRAGVPARIAHSHSTSGKGENAKNLVKCLLRTQANRYPTHRFACSRYAGEWLFGKGAEFEIVYNAIDLSRFSFDAKARARARVELGLADGQFAIGHVGRFMTQKNHKFLIDAFAEVARHRDDAVLLLVGSGELKPSIERRAVERGIAGKVSFLGQRDDVDRLYQAFDAFVLPSLYEGLCLVGVEAQRVGLPCLLSDTITREVDVTGTCKFLSIRDPRVWADALMSLPGCAEGVRAMKGHRDCFDRYDIEKAALKLTSYYRQLSEKA